MVRDKETTYRIMSAVKSKNTSPERLLGKAMWRLGLRYRKNYIRIEGKPDFVFISAKLAVFCDGDFWHGNNWRIRKMRSLDDELVGYSQFWRNKILRNIERDKYVNKQLKAMGWRVLRFWESEIKTSSESCAEKVLKAYKLAL